MISQFCVHISFTSNKYNNKSSITVKYELFPSWLCIIVQGRKFVMLRRIPTTKDGRVIDRLQESTRINRPFKPPTQTTQDRVQPQRKRKRVSYKEQGNDGSDSDEGPARKKKTSMDKDGIYHNEQELLNAIPKYPVYSVKPFNQVGSRKFHLPSMTSKDGKPVALLATHASLGIRPPAKIIPRPLHDPMQDHAIVLYDPTIDNRETDEEKKAREAEEAKVKAQKEAKEKTAGLYNPHKSLKVLLGEGNSKVDVSKVPVVIDPCLSKVLRPHQVEGVKVDLQHCVADCLTVLTDRRSFCINALQG
jgi:DNA repair and recombination RAD54-like protein